MIVAIGYDQMTVILMLFIFGAAIGMIVALVMPERRLARRPRREILDDEWYGRNQR